MEIEEEQDPLSVISKPQVDEVEGETKEDYYEEEEWHQEEWQGEEDGKVEEEEDSTIIQLPSSTPFFVHHSPSLFA